MPSQKHDKSKSTTKRRHSEQSNRTQNNARKQSIQDDCMTKSELDNLPHLARSDEPSRPFIDYLIMGKSTDESELTLSNFICSTSSISNVNFKLSSCSAPSFVVHYTPLRWSRANIPLLREFMQKQHLPMWRLPFQKKEKISYMIGKAYPQRHFFLEAAADSISSCEGDYDAPVLLPIPRSETEDFVLLSSSGSVSHTNAMPVDHNSNSSTRPQL